MTRVAPIEPFQDEDALGPKVYPQRPYPRRYARLTLPLGPYALGAIELPDSMSSEEWDRMMEFLVAARPAIVSDAAIADLRQGEPT